MAHVWLTQSDNSWAVLPLVENCYSLSGSMAGITVANNVHSRGDVARLVRTNSEGPERWVLISRAGRASVVLNGWPLGTGLGILCDRDEIRLSDGGRRLYFSTERVPVVEPFPEQAGAQATRCARCRQEIHVSSPIVQCPKCSVYFHATEDSPCWTYSPLCICGRSTDLEAGYDWVPHGL